MNNIREDETFRSLFDVITQHAETFKEVNARLKNADGGKDAAVADFVKNSDDEKARMFRERLAELVDAQRRYAEGQVQVPDALTDEERETLTKARNEARTSFRAGVKLVKEIAQVIGKDEDVSLALSELGDPTAGAVTPGSGLPKLSCHVVVTAKDGTTAEFENLSGTAKFLGFDVKTLLGKVAEAGGTSLADVSKLPVGQTVTLDVTTQSGTPFRVAVTPKERAKPGRKPASEDVTRSAE